MSRRHLVIRAALGLVALGVLGAAGLANEFLKGRPFRWRPVGASLRWNGKPVEGGVFRHGGLYLLELPRGATSLPVSVDPVARNVSLDNAPLRLFGERRTCTLRGVLVNGGGKIESRAVFEPTEEGWRIRITPPLASRSSGAASDLIELRPAAGS